MTILSAERPMKVLFFSQDGKLGDAIVNTAFVAGLLRHDPRCEIHATVAGATQGFWARDSRIKKLWEVHKPGWGEVLKLGMALRREAYDFIVPWRRVRSEKNRVLLMLARPGRVIDLPGFASGEVRHQIEACGEALVQMRAAEPEGLNYALKPPARCALLDQMLPDQRELIVVNLFAADAWRSIAAGQGVALLRGLARQAPGALLCLVCTNHTESAAWDVLRAADVGGRAVNCDGSLFRLFDLCRRADLVISPDTALVHVASAFDTPVIGIYQDNGIKTVQWAPRSRLHAMVLSDNADSISGFEIERVLEMAQRLRGLRAEPL